ncbi:MAG: CPBP family intramembrane glutamic endopeptidase [Candidatus Promineifilaceae bacterium]|nr:CPBP family intramembrane glutamic endopeptidase [Candidatus Promineifilaceae bacterium]
MSHLTVSAKDMSDAGAKPAQEALRPMSFKMSLLLWSIPTIIFVISFYGVIPWLESLGIPPMASFLTASIIPMAWMLTAALVGYHKVEGRPSTRSAFSRRMRFPKPRLKDVLLGIGVYLVGLVGLVLLTRVVHLLINGGLLPIPQNLPLFLDPRATISGASLDAAAGGTMRGQWELVILYLVYLFFNIAGEELWWRGYILPRQELRHGQWTWVMHGTLWAFFHLFKWWDILAILPLTLAMSFSAQRLRNNWPAAIAHLLGNLSFFLLILAGVLGLMS